MKPLKVGICGLGTVGCGTVNLLRENADVIEQRCGRKLEIVQVASRRKPEHCDVANLNFVDDIMEVANNPEVDVLVETIGGEEVAKKLVLAALENKKHVVTANKALIALHGNELFALAERNGVSIAFEAGVAGGIPILNAISVGLAANKIEWLAGIINGTGNFILSEMRSAGRAFDDVLAEAQALGYAEADPTFDVEGIDAAHKLVILAALAFGVEINFEGVFTEGISKIDASDVNYAEELGYRIKHLGIARKHQDAIELRVHPTLIPEKAMLAKVDGVMNAVMVHGNASGETVYYGAGAGAEATASAVVADLVALGTKIDVIQSGVAGASSSSGFHSVSPCNALPMSEIHSSYYLRISAEDHPGVLAKIALILSDHGINIESIMQKETELEDGIIPLILLTHQVQEKAIKDAVREIEELDIIDSSVTLIRVENF